MTVEELIVKLSLVEDKTQKVFLDIMARRCPDRELKQVQIYETVNFNEDRHDETKQKILLLTTSEYEKREIL